VCFLLNTMLVCVLSHIKSVVNLSIFVSFCPVTDIVVMVIVVKVCMIVDLSSGHKVALFGGDIFMGYQM